MVLENQYRQYYGTKKNFTWYKNGSHNDTELEEGMLGGIVQMVIKDGNEGYWNQRSKSKLDVEVESLLEKGILEQTNYLFAPTNGGNSCRRQRRHWDDESK